MSEARIALNRFGLGGRGDTPPPASPRRWLIEQFDHYVARPPAIAALPDGVTQLRAMADYLADVRMARRMQAAAPEPEADMADAAGAADPVRQARRFARVQARDGLAAGVAARLDVALTTATPFVERLVHFWSNHFAVSADKAVLIGLVAPFEFEAIRPHVLGRFSDMLRAVEQHPAMLVFLDQSRSIGPNSLIGQRLARHNHPGGLNENLAREILELHTLGVRSGYGQVDVGELAQALTGWSVTGIGQSVMAQSRSQPTPDGFAFAANRHEPGARTVLGRRYDQPGEAQGRAILADLAAHPATARHIATKLARHFVADEPPPALVARLERAFLTSGGDLPTVYRALLEAPEAWTPASAKFRTPWDWSVAALRAVNADTLPGLGGAGLFNQLGQPVWRPRSPAGWDDTAPSWAAPAALMRRVEAAERIAARAGAGVDARALAARLFPDGLSAGTERALARAEDGRQALALLLVSPELLRR